MTSYATTRTRWRLTVDELRDRIARALTDHRYLYAKKSMGGVREEFCTCGWSTDLKFAAWEDFARHQADAVDAALGMRKERRHGGTTTRNEPGGGRPDKRRWVTEGEEA